MKRTFLLIVLAVGACVVRAETATGRTGVPGFSLTSQKKPGVYMGGWGYIGGAHAEIEMNGMTGEFEYSGIKRKLKFVSYNKRTKILVLNEYDQRGRYIGKFVGHYEEFYVPEKQMTCMSYQGTFTNTKGKKAEFMLYYD